MSNISIADLSNSSELNLSDLSKDELSLSGGFWFIWVAAAVIALTLKHD